MRLVALASILIMAAAPAHGARGAPCLEGLAPQLVAGTFSGSVDCRRDRLAIRRVGDIRSGGHRFEVYAYRYQLALACPECAVHGGQRVIILRDRRYIGEYQADLMRIRVAHNDLILTPDDELGRSLGSTRPVALSFTAAGPPRSTSVDGESLDFFR